MTDTPVVLGPWTSDTGFTNPIEQGIWFNGLLIPGYVALLSALGFSFHTILNICNRETFPSSGSEPRNLGKHVAAMGGPIVFTFKLTRLVSCIALSVLTLISSDIMGHPGISIENAQITKMVLLTTYLYASLLALLSISLTSHRNQVIATRHLVVVLFVSWIVFVYRDIWPLATYTSEPADGEEGWLIWTKIGALTLAAALIPLFIPRQYTPLDLFEPMARPNEAQTASWASLLTHTFCDSLVFKAARVPHLKVDDLPPLSDTEWAKNLAKKGHKNLDPLVTHSKRHIFWPLVFKVFLLDHIEMCAALIFRVLLSLAGPIGINRLLTYLETGGEDAVIRPWFWLVWFFFGHMLGSVAYQWYNFAANRVLVEAQSMLTSLIFEHALRLRVKSEVGTECDVKLEKGGENFIGKLNNMVTADLATIQSGQVITLAVVYFPLQIALSMAALYAILGWSILPGLVALVSLSPLPGWVSKKLRWTMVARMNKSDARVQLVTDTLNVARMVKLFGWESKTVEQIRQTRNDELIHVRNLRLMGALAALSNIVITYATYTLVMKQQLTAARVFSSLAIFELVNDQLGQVFFWIPSMVQARVSLDRINDFLHNTELLDQHSDPIQEVTEESTSIENDIIGIREASFTWSKETDVPSADSNQRGFVLRIDKEVIFKKGKINLVVGQTGTGKTSLLMALLGEMHYIPDGPNSFVSLPRRGGVAYHAQESWVLNNTIRNNILFGSSYDETRYNSVLEQCALKQDIELFSAGDMTEVGEKGITLSGGQKARVTLARAVYSPANILLLDDVLAALDVHTARWVVDKCFKGDLLRGRTVILVTHNIALASPIADFVVALGTDGHILSQGSLSVALAKDSKLSTDVEEEIIAIEEAEKFNDESKAESSENTKKSSGKLIIAEEVPVGRVGWSAIKLFFGNMSGKEGAVVFWSFLMVQLAANKFANVLHPWVLGYWAEQYQERDPSEIPVPLYLSYYALAVFASFLFYSTSNATFTIGANRASRIIHDLLIKSVFGTTFRWLDRTPISRIIARCTADIQSIDGAFAQLACNLIDMTVHATFRYVAILTVSPAFSIPGIVLVLVGGWLGNLYLKAQLPVKRETSTARAPVLAHFGSAISGIVSIRAFGAQDAFKRDLFKLVDQYTRANRTFMNLNRWISVRMDALTALYTSSLAGYLIYFSTVTSSDIGFSLAMAVGFSEMVLWWISAFNQLETNANSLERVQQYLEIEQEPRPTKDGVPPAYWPASGDIRVEDLSARYSEDGPDVLHDITFHIKSGERIGIVGRTGSGKPELIQGTLRQNLDPFSQYDDATLNNALRAAGLFSLQNENDENKITLDTAISGGGSNLSVGQRQILALARAIIRQSKLLIMDEATSAIDYQTDEVIQTALRKDFSKDVTLLTIAHRLQTIMDADKIMVLDSGHLVEFDTPRALLDKKTGIFRAMVDESNDREKLYSMAKGAG
ncbi:P-loop containing nucleoside triphosphate hydrolase protein [Abortiporus biennis]|nr:P-loop containing nucleoside triphosphate hydrolase protein [Abortiporus biennis]